MSDAIDDLKDRVQMNLRLDATYAKLLDDNYASVSRGFSGVVLVLIIIGGIIAGFCGLIFITVIAAIAVMMDASTKRAYDNNRLHTIAGIISRHTADKHIQLLGNCIGAISLRSLRESNWSTNYSVVFPEHDGANFPYSFSSGSYAPYPGRTNADPSRAAFELCSGIFIQYHSVSISLKCDFRVIRTPLTKSEVASIFRSIAGTLPSVPLSGMDVKQFSSTKTYWFDQNYIDSGTMSYISERSSRRNLKYSKPDRQESRSSGCSSTEERAKAAPGSTRKDKGSGPNASALRPFTKSLLLLSDMVEKRKDVEMIAMNVAISYEISEGRSVEDVSSKSFGFDLFSTSSQNDIRRIEVKGLAGTGSVILTENEIKTAEEYRGTFWLYVVENCFSPEKTTLHAVQNLLPSDARQEAVLYAIDLVQQNQFSGDPFVFKS